MTEFIAQLLWVAIGDYHAQDDLGTVWGRS